MPAQLDSAADRTVIPTTLVVQLGLVPLDELPVSAFGGRVQLLPTHRVQLNIRSLEPLVIEALSHPDEPFVLVGRDVMNSQRIVLDGPQLSVEIG
ncbi:MAG TPA: hypothetical protein VKI65_18760 [Gemmataceae bacterium]|nr:hypothetical protein [Gemmataceae bacterium]